MVSKQILQVLNFQHTKKTSAKDKELSNFI